MKEPLNYMSLAGNTHQQITIWYIKIPCNMYHLSDKLPDVIDFLKKKKPTYVFSKNKSLYRTYEI